MIGSTTRQASLFYFAFAKEVSAIKDVTLDELDALLQDPELAFGVAAPYESSPDLEYLHLFSMNWSLITPPRHPFLRKPALKLKDLTHAPLILFERGSTGRQHVMDAFHGQGRGA